VADGPSVPILTYHSLDDTGSVISTPPAVFRDQMVTFARRGFRGIALGDLLEAWAGKAALPPRPLVLTFDDAFRSVAEHAAPVLSELGYRATVFAVAGYVGRTNDWPTQPGGVPRLPLCSWTELSGLHHGVAEIGGHGFDHRPLLESLDGAALRREVAESRRALEDGLGAPVTTFAYPYGVNGPRAREAVRESYRAACGVTLRKAAPRDDLHELGRIDAYYLRPPAAARAFGTPAGETYLWLRGLGRRLRGLGAAPPYRPA
jgi:peptidoglycan/xylan/chitin deacetylase (PgdA/CDA1 family)